MDGICKIATPGDIIAIYVPSPERHHYKVKTYEQST